VGVICDPPQNRQRSTTRGVEDNNWGVEPPLPNPHGNSHTEYPSRDSIFTVLVLCLVSLKMHCHYYWVDEPLFCQLTRLISFGHIHRLPIAADQKWMKHIRDVILVSAKINFIPFVTEVMGSVVTLSRLKLALTLISPSRSKNKSCDWLYWQTISADCWMCHLV